MNKKLNKRLKGEIINMKDTDKSLTPILTILVTEDDSEIELDYRIPCDINKVITTLEDTVNRMKEALNKSRTEHRMTIGV